MIEAVKFGHKAVVKICDALDAWALRVGKPKRTGTLRQVPEDLMALMEESVSAEIEAVLAPTEGKLATAINTELNALESATLERLAGADAGDAAYGETDVKLAFKKIAARKMRALVRETIQKALVSQSRNDGHAERVMFTHPSQLGDTPGPGTYAEPAHNPRAACFAELGEAAKCANDCDDALAALPPGNGTTEHARAQSRRALALKIHLRRAEARRRLGRLADARGDLDALNSLAVGEDERAAVDYLALQLDMISVS